MKPKFFKIEDDLYRTTIYVVSNCTMAELSKLIQKKGLSWEADGLDTDGGQYYKLQGENGFIVHLIWLKDWDSKNLFDSIIDLVHEVDHLAFSVLETAGIKCDFENSETHAYYQSWILEKCKGAFIKQPRTQTVNKARK